MSVITKFYSYTNCNNNNDTTDTVDCAVIMQELTRFSRWMQTERQAAADPQTKPTKLGCESSGSGCSVKVTHRWLIFRWQVRSGDEVRWPCLRRPSDRPFDAEDYSSWRSNVCDLDCFYCSTSTLTIHITAWRWSLPGAQSGSNHKAKNLSGVSNCKSISWVLAAQLLPFQRAA